MGKKKLEIIFSDIDKQGGRKIFINAAEGKKVYENLQKNLHQSKVFDFDKGRTSIKDQKLCLYDKKGVADPMVFMADILKAMADAGLTDYEPEIKGKFAK